MNIEKRVNREKISHTEDDIFEKSVKLKKRFHHIFTYPSLNRLLSEFENKYSDSKSLTVLDYGCGKGYDSLKLLESGAKVFGIDISEKYIESARNLAIKNNHQETEFNFQVMDAHNLTFENDTFDLVIGNGILHHLDTPTALKSIYRVLKPGGRAVFREPLASNPLLKLFRFLTPRARTIDESPFSGSDLKKLIDLKLWDNQNVMYCGLVCAPVAMITSIILPKYPDNLFLRYSDKLEKKLNRYNFFKPLNQYILFDLKKL